MDLYCKLVLAFDFHCVAWVGDFDPVLQGIEESSVKYHSMFVRCLTLSRYPARGQCLRVSFTGAVSS